MKKILSFFGLCFYIVGAIGGLGWSLYGKGYFIACCVALLVVYAFPTAKKLYGNLLATEPKKEKEK